MGCFHFLKQSNHITAFKVSNSTLEGNPLVLYYNNASLSRACHNILWFRRKFNSFYTIYSNYLIIFYNYISCESISVKGEHSLFEIEKSSIATVIADRTNVPTMRQYKKVPLFFPLLGW